MPRYTAGHLYFLRFPGTLVFMAFLLISLLLFLLGTCLGSFLGVVINRTINGGSWVTGRSRCDHCHKELKWFDMVPLFSYVWLRGRCRFCHKKISASHPVIEFMTGTLVVWWYWIGTLFFQLTQRPFQTIQPIFWLLIGILLLFIFFTDWLYYIIPDEAVILLMILVGGYRIALVALQVMQPIDLLYSGIGSLVVLAFFWSIWWLSKGRGMGFGDVKLVLPLGLLLGWPNMVVGVFMAFITGAIWGMYLLVTKKAKFGQVVPFGPFLVIGTFVALVWGDYLVTWYLGLL
jgi:leader peptidase (prepilin peptidase)/N-methyltransferase